jgi:deoxyribodipyrimidine photolyase-like uncharacterized protein
VNKYLPDHCRSFNTGDDLDLATTFTILGDHLSMSIASLSDIDKRVLMVELNEEATYVRHHQQKPVYKIDYAAVR